MLEKEHELALIEQAQKGSESAKSTLYVHHESYIKGFSRKYMRSSSSLSREDLFQHAIVGFLDSINHYNLTSNARLATYATHRMRSEIFDYTNSQKNGIKLFTTKPMKKAFFNINKYRQDTPYLTLDQVKSMAKDLDVPVRDVVEVEKRLCVLPTSFDAVSDEGLSLSETISVDEAGEMSPESIIAKMESSSLLSGVLGDAVNSLDDRLKTIILKRVMIGDEGKVSLAKLGSELGVSFERVRQLEVEALKHIKSNLFRSGFDDAFCN